MASEFEIIRKHFSFSKPSNADGILLGVGDDAAVLAMDQKNLVIASDALVEGTHFLPNTPPASIARRLVAVNVSDFSAMGARPRWCTLSLTMPKADDAWLSAFSGALAAELKSSQVFLIGGDTCRGPLNLSLTMLGTASGELLKRSGANEGDDLWVSGTLGESAVGLAMLKGDPQFADLDKERRQFFEEAFFAPASRLGLGEALKGVASAAMDISDGLLADARHIAEQSNVSIEIQAGQIPLVDTLDGLSQDERLAMALAGDDYELLFTVSPHREGEILEIAQHFDLPLTKLGVVKAASADCVGVELVDESGLPVIPPKPGYRHF